MPWIRKAFVVNAATEEKLVSISPRQIDRLLYSQKRTLKRRLYGRTKPGTLLKHHIPIKTDHGDVKDAGFTEVDLVSHSGERAEGEFAYAVNQTDILTGWVETRGILGRGEMRVIGALDDMEQAFPFTVKGIDSDNGSEFINHHLWRRCQEKGIQFTRGRPYKKDDNAHIEQKNWTQVRKLMGWERYDTAQAVEAMNDLYRNERSRMMNLFQPSVKLVKKVRVGSRLKRVYDAPKTPLDRLIQASQGDPKKIAALKQLQSHLNPFDLSRTIEKKLDRIYKLAHIRRPQPPKAQTTFPQSSKPVHVTQEKTHAYT